METKSNKLINTGNLTNIKPSKEKIAAGIALLLAVIIIFYVLSKLNRKMIVWIVTALMFGFGLWCIAGYPKQQRINKKNVTEMVSAIVSEVKEIVHKGKNGDWRTYFTTYEYKFKGILYRVQSKEEYDEKPSEGVDTKLLIDPDEPTEIYEVEREKSRVYVMKFVGIFFIVCGFFMLMNQFA